MRYFRNNELVELYDVSDKTVRNWIENAQTGKNQLELYKTSKKAFIADTVHNSEVINRLVNNGRKYRNQRSHRIIAPQADFYRLFSNSEIADIIASLEVNHEYPHQYCYRGDGAKYWDSYLHKLVSVGSNNYLADVKSLLAVALPEIDRLAKNFSHMDVFDVGVGNGSAVSDFLQSLPTNKLRSYTGIDISPELLQITEANLKSQLGSKIPINKLVKDISFDRFGDALLAHTHRKDTQTINLVLFLGGTIVNFPDPRDAIRTIRESMGKSDILITSLKTDTPTSRRFFEFNPQSSMSLLPPHFKYALDLLNIDESFYSIEQYYDEYQSARFVKVRLKYNVTIEIANENFFRNIEFQKNDLITLWRAHHYTDDQAVRLWTRNGFSLLCALRSEKEDYLLLVLRRRHISTSF